MSYPSCAPLRRASRGLRGASLLTFVTVALLIAGAAGAVDKHARVGLDQPNFDGRAQLQAVQAAPQTPEQLQALDALRVETSELMVTFDHATGVTRTLYDGTGYLTDSVSGDHLDIALDWVKNNARALGLSPADVQHFEVTDNVYSAVTGASHIYLRQTHRNIPLYNGQLHVNVNRDGKIISVNNAFMPGFAQSVNNHRPSLTAAEAVAKAAEHVGIDVAPPQALGPGRGARQVTPIDPTGISTEPIEASLMWLPVERGDARLAWNFQIVTDDGQHWFDFTVDAHEGSIWTRFDWVSDGTYRVYKEPDESPLHGTTSRALVVDPEHPTASPNGWFAGGTMDGNNVHACPDTDGNNVCDSNPQCTGTTCDFPINLSQQPSTYIPAATANLFYWNNLIHDVQYQYGFDEPGGNFQENNFGRGGAGSDSVNADAQDGSGNCNANFATPTDGGNPRMQMFTCNMASPSRDGDLDNGVIVHEYGHGISIRQVGGPANSSCLNNSQQPGEGWSDWFGLVYTAEVGDAGTDSRGIGTYLFGQGPNGPGIRDLPYSTDPAINNWTYESIAGASIPHGVGSRWAQAIWEVYWALVAKHGFAAGDQLLDPVGGGWTGSHRALLYVNEGLKNTACSPTFLQTRDGIIQAATDNFGGEDVCDVWEAFAAFGLGTDASTPGSGSTSATNGFSVPAACQCSPQPIADAGPDQNICLGESATLGTPAQAGHTYSWSPGGQTTAQITVTPSVDTTFTVTATTACGSASDSATVFVDDGSVPAGLNDDFEGDNSDWTATGLWHQATDSACATPGYSSPLNAFYYGQDASCTYDTGAANSGTLTSPPISGITSTSTLTFDYWRQVESFSGDFDRTQVNILAGGSTTVFSLNSSNPSQSAWVSSGPIDLSAFAGQTIQVQFVFNTGDNVANNFTGWFIDDVVVTGESSCAPTGNQPPTATINAPADGSSFDEGDTIAFSGTASDAEDGDLTASLSWTSSLDGAIGTGGSFSTVLSVGTHTITASVTDSGGLSGSDSITVTVNPNTPPTVNITAPANGSSFVQGTSVTFTGTASDTQDGDLTASLSWTSSLDGAIGSGGSFSTSTLSLGTHTITASVTDSGGLSGSDSITVDIVEDTGQCTDCIDWNVTSLVSYSNQDPMGGIATVEDGGATIALENNTWKRTTQTFTVGPDTVLEFEYSSTSQGEIHGIGFDENDTLNDAPRHYQIWGTQNWTGTGKIRVTAQQYSGSGAFETFQIPVGQDLNGTFFLVLINDNDVGSGNNGRFRNVRVFEDTPEPPPPGTCAADVDFEDGTSNNWTTSGTCTTGTFTVGTPDQVLNGGVITQLGGDHTTGTGNAWFTQPNTGGAGVDDVDGGECVTTSPTYAVGEASNVSVWYYHGQRDAGDDPGGDFFFLEISRDSGATWSTLASFGDVTVNAAWTQATTTAAAGENVRFRVRASDGAAAGDLVEAGIDDVQICPTP